MSAFCIDKQNHKLLVRKASQISKDAFLNDKKFNKPTNNNLLNSALWYANLGCSVFPLHNLIADSQKIRCSCRYWKTCKIIGKHPRTRNGLLDATNNEKRIREWWTIYPDANIGLLTGFQTKLLVLDIDIKSGGEFSLEFFQEDYKILLKDNYQPLPATLTAITGSGGRHLYFNYPDDLKTISSSASDIADGLDIRANGGYVVAPPSKHLSGNHYSWFGINTPIKNVPSWLIYEILKAEKPIIKTQQSTSKSSFKLADGEKVSIGNRNTYLFKQACGLANSYPKEEVLRRAFQINGSCFEIPLSEKEVTILVDGVYRQYVNRKRNN